MKNILNHLDNILLIISPNGSIQFANTPALNFFKTTNEALKGKLINHLLELEAHELASYLKAKQPVSCSIQTKTSPQIHCFIELTAQTWYGMNCFMLLIRPIEEALNHSFLQKLIEEKIDPELEAFLTTTVDLFAVIDSQTGKFIKVNDRWESVLGWQSHDLVHIKTLPELEYPPSGKSESATLSYLNQMDSIRDYVTEYRCKNGEYKLLECNYKKLEEETLAIFTAKDITEQENLRIQKKNLENAVHLENLRSEFFATVSHELRTPLNIILATLQLIDSENQHMQSVFPNQNKYHKIMCQNAYRLLKLINNIIDSTKIEDGYFSIKLGNYNIVSLVESIAGSTIDYMKSKDIDFIFDTEIEEEYIACDPDLIERIVLNLLSNSIKYCNPEVKGIICVNISLEEDFVVLHVQDNGIGIPAEKLEVIFKRFIQVDNALSQKKEGSGIGLSLVKSLVEMHNGSIHVKSQLNKGSEFIIKLPRKIIPNQDLEEVSEKLLNHSINKLNIEFSDICRCGE